jgi:hypothetical protein
MEHWLPNRVNERIDKDDPNVACSSTDNELPRVAVEKIESLLPKRTKLRMDVVDAN